MFTRRNLFGLILAIVGTAVVIGDATPVLAQGGSRDRTRLTASMSSGATKAVAKYEQRSFRRKFTFELEKGRPGTVVTFRHNGINLATRTVDGLGRAKLDIDTTDGNAVPTMVAGQVASVWVGEKVYMSGVLR